MAIIVFLIIIVSLGSRQVLIQRMDHSYDLSMQRLEFYFRDLYLAIQLRNLSHTINANAINYFITSDKAMYNEFEQHSEEFFNILSELKKSGAPETQNIEVLQREKIKILNTRFEDLSKGKVDDLLSPDLMEMSQELRTLLEALISFERQNYDQAREELTQARVDVLNSSLYSSLILLAFTLALGVYLIIYAKKLRLAHQETLEAIKLRDDVLAVVSHDLKNPLSSIGLNTQFLHRKVKQSKQADQGFVKGLESIRRSVGVMNELIQDLLDRSKLVSGNMQLNIGKENFFDLLNEVEEVIDPLASEKSIVIKDHLPSEPVLVKGDKRRLIQVLSNLLSNAVKFTPEGGKIDITADPVGRELVVSVQDTGPGIRQDELPLIFDRYWQAQKTAKQGTGLGLSIVKGLVEAHGGRIWVESKLNEGSKFCFTVPLAH